MRQRFQDTYNGLLEKWNTLEKNQQAKLIATVVVLLVVLVATIYMLTRPRMTVVMSGLDYKTAGEVKEALTNAGINCVVSDNGTYVSVEEKYKNEAEILLAMENIPSGGAFPFETAMGYMSFGSTESVKSAALIKTQESDLEEKLKGFEGVRKASVTLNLGDQNTYFIKTGDDARASVLLTLDKELDKNQSLGIARFVSKSVIGLDMENIEIRDQYANAIYSGSNETDNAIASIDDVANSRKRMLEAEIRSILLPIYDEAKITSTLYYDWNKMQERSTILSNPSEEGGDRGFVDQETNSQSSVTGGETGAEPGVEANNQEIPNYLTGEAATGEASSKNSTSSYLYNQTETVLEGSTGDFLPERSSVFVTVYKYETFKEAELENSDLLQNQTWSEFKNSITAETFDVEQELIDGLREGTGIQALNVVGFTVPLFQDKEETPIPIEQIVLFVILAILILLLAYGLIKKTQPDEITEIEPELSVEDLLVSSQLEEEQAQEEEELAEQLTLIAEPENQRQIEQFIEDQPEAVAQLLRNWLNEEWGE